MGAAGSSARRRLKSTSWNSVDGGGPRMASTSGDDRDELAECLAFISDMALTGDADSTCHRTADLSASPARTCPQGHVISAPAEDVSDAAAAGEQMEEEETIPEPPDRGVCSASGGTGRTQWLKDRFARLRLPRQRSAPGAGPAASVDDSVSSHIQMLNSLDSQDDDSEDWAEMRSWLVWCLRDKLGDADVLTAGHRRHSPLSSLSSPCRSASTTSRGTRQLVRQQAVHERSPRIGVVDCSEPGATGSAPTGRLMLRCRSAETGGEGSYGVSLDGSGGDTGSVAGRLTVGASCSGQSSFESYGSAG